MGALVRAQFELGDTLRAWRLGRNFGLLLDVDDFLYLHRDLDSDLSVDVLDYFNWFLDYFLDYSLDVLGDGYCLLHNFLNDLLYFDLNHFLYLNDFIYYLLDFNDLLHLDNFLDLYDFLHLHNLLYLNLDYFLYNLLDLNFNDFFQFNLNDFLDFLLYNLFDLHFDDLFHFNLFHFLHLNDFLHWYFDQFLNFNDFLDFDLF